MFNFNIKKEIRPYFIGFLLSVFFTIIPFFLVIEKFFSKEFNYVVILLCAIIQIVIHFVYFLHLNFSLEQRWNLITLLFVIVIIFIVVFGSIWIMFNLNHSLMC